MKDTITLSAETIKTIKKSIREFFKHYELTQYRVNKIVKNEVEHPCLWATFPDGDNSDDACALRYYENLNSSNIYLNWIDNVQSRYGIWLPNYHKEVA